MHEAGIAAEILDKAVEAAGNALGPGTRVVALRVRVGEFSGVDREALRFALEALSRGGPAENCQVDLVFEPLVVTCACGHTAGSESMYGPCPACGSASWQVTAGRDLLLMGVEAENPDADENGEGDEGRDGGAGE